MVEKEQAAAAPTIAKLTKNTSAAYRRGYRAAVKAAAAVARERAAICADAVEQIKAGKLYQDTPHAQATENSARMEASHIARLIDALEPAALASDDPLTKVKGIAAA